MRTILATVAVLCLTAASVSAQDETLGSVEEFKQEHGPYWEITLDETFGTPRTIFADDQPSGVHEGERYSIYSHGETRNEKAYSFLARYPSMFQAGIGGRVEGALLPRDAPREAKAVKLDQHINGERVYGNGYTVYFNEDDEIYLVMGRFNPSPRMPEAAVVPLSAARDIALAFVAELTGFPDARGLNATSSGQTLVDTGEGLYRAHVFNVSNVDFTISKDVHVDAVTGRVVHSSTTFPTITEEEYDGSQWEELPLAFAAALDPTIGSVYDKSPGEGGVVYRTLEGLTSLTLLKGRHSDVIHANGTRATSGPDFLYSPSNNRFDEVNVYYHLDKVGVFATGIYAQTTLSPSLPQTLTKVHYPGPLNNASYNFGPGLSEWRFNQTSAGVNLPSRDDDVIRHEFGHFAFIQNGFEYLEDKSNGQYKKDRAIHEGSADYLAATYDGDPVFAKWFASCTSTGDLRRLDSNPSYYRGNNGFENLSIAYNTACPGTSLQTSGNGQHHQGMIWSGAMWDVRAAIGASATDEALLEMLTWDSQDIPTFEAAATLFKGSLDVSDRCEAKTALSIRGLSSACDPYVDPDPDYRVGLSGSQR